MISVNFEYFLVGIALLLISWPFIRAFRLSRLREQIRSKMQWSGNEAQILRDQISQFARQPINQTELAAYGMLSASEFVWSWARIDPAIVHAAAFSSSAPIRNGYDFAQYVHSHYDTLGLAAKEGFFNRLLGYLGEQQVADLLAHQGHVVQAAASATQPVWDLLVDGHPVNVKTIQDLASIKAEAIAHHGITYLVPTDAQGHLTENMAHIAGFKHDAAHSGLKEGLASAHGEHALHGIGMHLPLLTIGFSAYRNYQAVQLGKDVAVAVKHTVVESVGRGAGGVVGAKAGALAGSFFGPLGTVIGAVGGAVGGALLGGSVAEQYKRKPLDAAILGMQISLHDYGMTFTHKLESVRGYLEAPLIRMQSSLRGVERDLAARKSRIAWWIWPDFRTVLLEETLAVGQDQMAEEQQRVRLVTKVFERAKSTGRFEEIGLMMVNVPAVCELIGFDKNKLAAVAAARQSVFHERKQLNPHFVAP